MEDIRRMEEETQKELEEVISYFWTSRLSCQDEMGGVRLSPHRTSPQSQWGAEPVLDDRCSNESHIRCVRKETCEGLRRQTSRGAAAVGQTEGRLSKCGRRGEVALHGSHSPPSFTTPPSGYCLTQPSVCSHTRPFVLHILSVLRILFPPQPTFFYPVFVASVYMALKKPYAELTHR